MLLTWLLASLHVLAAIAWLGGAMIFGIVIGPALDKLSPVVRGEFMVKVVPRIVRFFQAVAGMTVLFGALLLYDLGGASLLDTSTAYGLILSVAIVLAVVSFVVSEFLIGPTFMRAVRLTSDMLAAGSRDPPPELKQTMTRAIGLSLAVLILLVVVAIGMVGAGFY